MKQATDQAFYLLDSFDWIFSDYKPSSETMLLAKQPAKEWIRISKPLYDLIEKSLTVSEVTADKFTISIGALTQLWRHHLANEKIPSRRLVRKARKKSKSEYLQLSTNSLQLKKNIKGLKLDFGGIAKGYIADHLGKVMEDHGLSIFLIDLGGDLLAGDAPPGKTGWRINVSWCNQVIEIAQAAVATSGPDFQFFVHKGDRYAHIIDPETGWGVRNFFAATVIAKTGWQADAFASAFSILAIKKSKDILNGKNSLDAIIGRGNELFQSKNFFHYIVN